MRPFLIVTLTLSSLASAHLARAALLPYTVRTQSYSGWDTTVHGDTRTVGMAGATIGLPDTFLSSSDNPAGLAMLLPNADNNISSNRKSDGHIQNRDEPVTTGSLGLAIAFYPWAMSLGYVTSSREGQHYELLTAPGDPLVSVTSRELRLGLSRVMFNNRFSLGVSLNVGQANEQIDFESEAIPNASASSYGVGATFGMLFQLRQHVLLGASYTLPVSYGFADELWSAPPIPGFYQPLISPARLGLGAGWIPNRYFRASFSTHIVGLTQGAALLRDNRALVGSTYTLQPRLGAAYTFIDYAELRATAFAGTYFEMSRIDDRPHRFHATGGLEMKLWLFTLGAAADVAPSYSNILASVGFDLIKALIKFDIIPTPYSPPRAGLFPKPLAVSDEGLARPLVRDWRPHGPNMNPVVVIQQIPERTEKKIEEVKEIFTSQDEKRALRTKKLKPKASRKKPKRGKPASKPAKPKSR